MSVIAGVDFSQTSVISVCWGFSCCPYYRGVRYSGVSARRELTVNVFRNCSTVLCCFYPKQLRELAGECCIILFYFFEGGWGEGWAGVGAKSDLNPEGFSFAASPPRK